jgi:hypothetical protein
MTISGGGKSPLLQLHPKNFKSLFGEVRRGSFNPFDLTEEIPRAEALGMTQ